jgi:hypothetical protein
MSASGQRTRILVLTGTGLSLIVSTFALFAHNRLYSNDLRRAGAAESALVRRLPGAGMGMPAPERSTALDAAEVALSRHPLALEPAAAVCFEGAELERFAAARVRAPFESSSEVRTLVAPSALAASYALGAVTLSWDPGALNRVRAAEMAAAPSDLRLVFRVYRAIAMGPAAGEGELQLLATLPFGEGAWRDSNLPIAASRLAYQVWVALLRTTADGDVLVGAEGSDLVTVTAPEHFTLNLLRGDGTEAVFEVQVNLPGAVSDTLVTARPGEELKVGDWTTGLTLRTLEPVRQSALATQTRLLLTTDGSLVLDPETNEPRTTQSLVLQPVTRLIATLESRDGASRTLQVDLP